MPVYSFGEDSPIKFEISDKLAKNYNEAVDKFFKAQQRFNQKFGRQWNPDKDPIEMRWTRRQQKAWSKFGKVFDDVIKREGPFHVNDITDDFLVKNTFSAAIYAVANSDRWIYAGTMVGALYVLLRGL